MTMASSPQSISIGTTLGPVNGLNRSIVTEFGGGVPHSLNEYQTFLGQSSGAQISLSDFYGLSNVVHETTMVAAYQTIQYSNISGYGSSVTGDSLGDDVIDSICGLSSVTITDLFNLNGSLNLSLSRSNSTFSNSGWTTMKVWVGQNNNSGTPTATFPRTGTGSYHSGNTSFNSSTGSCTYFWTGVQQSNAFGTTHTTNCFIEIV
tara:strand:+ start:457 stop:1071 length:615 start_codon:yes stop_codon:yes gene_type:complete